MADDKVPPGRDVHHALNQPAADPDPTEWPDPFDKRPDPRDPVPSGDEMDFGDVRTATGSTSTSEPHHEVDPQVAVRAQWRGDPPTDVSDWLAVHGVEG